jgi:hypothetical protein
MLTDTCISEVHCLVRIETVPHRRHQTKAAEFRERGSFYQYGSLCNAVQGHTGIHIVTNMIICWATNMSTLSKNGITAEENMIISYATVR